MFNNPLALAKRDSKRNRKKEQDDLNNEDL